MPTISELYARLTDDPVRHRLGFDPAFEAAQTELLDARTDDDRAAVLGRWLGTYQPCLFGKIAARRGMIEYVFLGESDFELGDTHVRDKIADGHRRWWAASLAGAKSGFVLLCHSPRLANARPDEALLRFAQRVAQLYLNKDSIEPDVIWTDETFLEVPARPLSHLFRWDAGVNVFAAPGDRRWWADHRIPGGLAFSVNSVGHMVKSAQLAEATNRFKDELKISADVEDVGKVDSLGKALELAMTTIANASETSSGPATWLLSADTQIPREGAECPIELKQKLSGKWHCEYRGMYHTDVTLPSSYFRDDVDRPTDLSALLLDFTYLFHDSVENSAFQTMGKGQQLRTAEGGDSQAREISPVREKESRMVPTQVNAADYPAIVELLRERVRE